MTPEGGRRRAVICGCNYKCVVSSPRLHRDLVRGLDMCLLPCTAWKLIEAWMFMHIASGERCDARA